MITCQVCRRRPCDARQGLSGYRLGPSHRLAAAGWAVDEGGLQFGPGSPGSVGARSGGRAKVLSHGPQDGEVFASGDGAVALAYGVDDSSGGRVEAGEGDASGEGLACEAFFDDVGDAVVDVVEQGLEAAEDAGVDDGVGGELVQPGDGDGRVGRGGVAGAEESAEFAQISLDLGVGVGTVSPGVDEPGL